MSALKKTRRTWILVGLFLLTLPAVAYRPHTADEFEYFAFLRSAWFDRDLSFENEYRYFVARGFTNDPAFTATFIEPKTATGLAPTFATIGCAILWAPFYLVADAGVRLARIFGSGIPADGFSGPYLAAVAYGSVCYGVLALVIAASVARRLTGTGAWAALVVFAGTPLIFYMYVMPLMAHACSAFVVAAFVWIWLRVRETWSVAGVATLAAAGALMAMVREQEAFVILAPAVDYLWSLTTRQVPLATMVRGGATRLAVSAVVFAACVTPQAIAYLTINGRLGPSPVVSNKMYWTAPWATRVLASPEHGWFVWTPLALVALAGLLAMAIRRDSGGTSVRRVAVLLLLVVATQVYVSGSVASWTLAGAFGQRRMTGLTLVLTVGVAWLLARQNSIHWRWMVRALIGLTIWWNLGLAVQFGEHTMNRQRLEPARNAYATFIDLPLRAPQIAYRYLFDRRSFYESHLPEAGP